MKFRVKADKILTLNPDILIVPECENPDKLIFSSNVKKPTDVFWYGENKNKGLGIFSYSTFKIKLHTWHNPDFRMILPLSISNETEEFTMFAIWANNPNDSDNQYIGQVWKAINYYQQYITGSKTILIGDFNSNTIWDKKNRIGNHSHVVEFLKERNIYSLYHHYFSEEQSQETKPTLFLYRHENKPYHIDYCFASKCFLEKTVSVSVGQFSEWIKHSDHMPVIIDIEG